MNGIYEVLNPWADVDPIPSRGISPRLSTLAGKKIGLFINGKRAAPLMMTVVERKLKERFPTAEFTRFRFEPNREVIGTSAEAKFMEWIKGVDTVVGAVGD